MRGFRVLSILAGMLSISGWCGAARAETPSLALDCLQLAPAGDPFLTTEGASAARDRVSLQLAASYARAPLTYVTPGGELAVVRYQAIAHAALSWEVARRLKLDVAIPVAFAQAGEAATTRSYEMPAPDARALGQPRAGARLTLMRQTAALPAVAVSLRAFIPHGAQDAYGGTDAVRFQPSLIVSHVAPRWLWSASIWRSVRASRDTYAELAGSEVGLSAALALRAGRLQVGPEGYAATVADSRTHAFRDNTTSAEVLLAARWRVGPLSFGLAGGPGFGQGAGTPLYRLLAAVTYSSAPEADDADATAVEPRPLRPPRRAPKPSAPVIADRDADSVPDVADACPEVPGDAKGPRPGCPADQDGDGIGDAEDRCPAEAGPASPDPERHGCPPDSDGDGIADTVDACPNEKGPPAQDPKTNGCPNVAQIQGPQIVIQQQILFETAKDVLLPESVPVLQALATLLNDHAEIARVAVDGHTDNAGTDAQNLQLAQRRSLTVMRWLIDHGVDARRLESRAFGMRRPIADNKSPEGRAKNRRVEFLIRRRTDKGSAGWTDGPLP